MIGVLNAPLFFSIIAFEMLSPVMTAYALKLLLLRPSRAVICSRTCGDQVLRKVITAGVPLVVKRSNWLPSVAGSVISGASCPRLSLAVCGREGCGSFTGAVAIEK